MELTPINTPIPPRATPRQNAPVVKSTRVPEGDRFSLSDNYEDRLKRVEARIKSGFYTSLEVRLDLSEKLSKVLDQMT